MRNSSFIHLHQESLRI